MSSLYALPPPLMLVETLCVLAQFSAAFRKCLRELKKICGSRQILPRSYTLPYNLTIQSEAFTSGGFGDIYRGTLDRSEVCVKRVRVYATDGQKEASRVRFRRHRSLLHFF